MTPTDCPVCAYADQYGCWPPDHRGTHCRGCHRSWTSTVQAHCTVCHAHFATDGVAERHWGKAGHTDPTDVEGLFLCAADGVWSTSPDRDPGALRRRLAEARQISRSTSPTRAESPVATSGGVTA